jgi:hypothetical protein
MPPQLGQLRLTLAPFNASSLNNSGSTGVVEQCHSRLILFCTL